MKTKYNFFIIILLFLLMSFSEAAQNNNLKETRDLPFINEFIQNYNNKNYKSFIS